MRYTPCEFISKFDRVGAKNWKLLKTSCNRLMPWNDCSFDKIMSILMHRPIRNFHALSPENWSIRSIVFDNKSFIRVMPWRDTHFDIKNVNIFTCPCDRWVLANHILWHKCLPQIGQSEALFLMMLTYLDNDLERRSFWDKKSIFPHWPIRQFDTLCSTNWPIRRSLLWWSSFTG